MPVVPVASRIAAIGVGPFTALERHPPRSRLEADRQVRGLGEGVEHVEPQGWERPGPRWEKLFWPSPAFSGRHPGFVRENLRRDGTAPIWAATTSDSCKGRVLDYFSIPAGNDTPDAGGPCVESRHRDGDAIERAGTTRPGGLSCPSRTPTKRDLSVPEPTIPQVNGMTSKFLTDGKCLRGLEVGHLETPRSPPPILVRILVLSPVRRRLNVEELQHFCDYLYVRDSNKILQFRSSDQLDVVRARPHGLLACAASGHMALRRRSRLRCHVRSLRRACGTEGRKPLRPSM